MNVVFLSPHFPPHYYRFCQRLREVGANVLGLADEPYDNLHSKLRASLNEYYKVHDMHDYDAMVRAMGYFTHRHGKIDRLDSLNEYWLEMEAQLRTDFNVFGVKNDDIMKIKRKSEMKKIFQKAGVRVARGRVCLNEEETREFIREVGYPVVAKPDIGVGAAKTYKIMDDWELRHYLSDKLPVDYILEEFIAGQIVTYDGMTDRDGRLVFVASHEYSKGVMETVNEDSDIYYYGVREIPGDLDKVGKAVLKAFNVRERFFHLEFFRLPDNQIVALEVNMRPPGGLTTDMFNFANDIDVYKMWAEILVRGHTDAQATRPYFCAYVGRKNSISYALSHDQVMQHFHGMIVNASQIDGVFSRAIGNYGYIIRHPDLEAIVNTANEIHRRA